VEPHVIILHLSKQSNFHFHVTVFNPISNCFHFNQNEVFYSGFFQLTFGVNSSIQELGDVITKVPPGATRDGNLSRNWYGLGRRQTKFAARTQPNCPKSVGKLQASP